MNRLRYRLLLPHLFWQHRPCHFHPLSQLSDYQLSLAIGKEGQNARLAARLTGFKIDIKSETQARESGDFMDYENDYEEDDYDDDYDYSDEELAENERLADTEQADVQAEAFDTEADENEAAGTENDAADSGDEQ